ncbi:uncharacterized protein LTR77_007562 [Saxophila tyrrhenica]|uniref:Hypervirulence associated protein TUDOR domain-containing protein n=1 Tax=Saxophila tyrrhenica TaxID=1690608 RepID=A0AAV9P332_9PEZI|nr:hypothetical protein LTR77_007562 [Saxophila tyrrhenica]
MPPKDKYTDPELRDQVKEEIQESDKGGAPGQWSARKAQMMAQEYKKRGGSYNTDKSQQDESQKNLSKWSEEEWQTKEGSGNAKQEDGTEKRYLPKKAWENMSEKEKEETDEKKQEESKEGKQFVQNTGKAKQSRKKANEEESEKYEEKKAKEQQQNGDEEDEEEEGEGDDAAEADDSEEEYQDPNGDGEDDDGEEEDDDQEDEGEDDAEQDEEDSKPSAGQKRKQTSNGPSSNKKQKQTSSNKNGGNAPPGKVGSKHMNAEEPAPRGSADRLPKEGQQVTWKAMPGYVDGSVEEILMKEKEVEGKTIKASEKDPRLVLKSNSSGKICVHKPEACFYE